MMACRSVISARLMMTLMTLMSCGVLDGLEDCDVHDGLDE
jgi:hypothetical protein